MVTWPSGKAKVCKTFIHQFKSGRHLHKTVMEKMSQSFFFAVSLKIGGFANQFLDTVLQCCPTILVRFSQLDAHFSCRFPEFGRGGGNFFEKKQNKSCCFQNVFNFLAANFLLAAGIFRFFSTVFSLFSSFPFYTYYNKEDFHHEYHYRYRPRLLRYQDSALFIPGWADKLTKFGIHFDMSSPAVNKPLVPDSCPEVIRASVEASLKRLNTDHIDLYYQHRLDPKVPIEEVARVMADLIREGKITHWGLSEANAETIRRAHAVCPVTTIQNRCSMMARWYEELFPMLEELHIGYVAFSPLANGSLSGRYDKNTRFEAGTDYRSVMPQFQPEGIDQNRALLDLLNKLAGEKNATPAQISLAWMLCKKPYIVPIPGTRKAARLQENAGAADVCLSAAEVQAIDTALGGMEMSQVFGGSRVVQ